VADMKAKGKHHLFHVVAKLGGVNV